jgi:hypothetical protein
MVIEYPTLPADAKFRRQEQDRMQPPTPPAANPAADKHAEAMDWEICHFCKRYKGCERWFKSWRCSDCRAANMPPSNLRAFSEAQWRELPRSARSRARDG